MRLRDPRGRFVTKEQYKIKLGRVVDKIQKEMDNSSGFREFCDCS